MSRRVLKFPLPHRGECSLSLPVMARVRHVGEQAGELMMWVEITGDLTALFTQVHRFLVVYTGHDDIPGTAMYIGTVVHGDRGSFVSHVYELR